MNIDDMHENEQEIAKNLFLGVIVFIVVGFLAHLFGLSIESVKAVLYGGLIILTVGLVFWIKI